MQGKKASNAVRQSLIDQAITLRDLYPVLHKEYSKGEILIVGAVYDIHTGKVDFLKETITGLPVKKSK